MPGSPEARSLHLTSSLYATTWKQFTGTSRRLRPACRTKWWSARGPSIYEAFRRLTGREMHVVKANDGERTMSWVDLAIMWRVDCGDAGRVGAGILSLGLFACWAWCWAWRWPHGITGAWRGMLKPIIPVQGSRQRDWISGDRAAGDGDRESDWRHPGKDHQVDGPGLPG